MNTYHTHCIRSVVIFLLIISLSACVGAPLTSLPTITATEPASSPPTLTFTKTALPTKHPPTATWVPPVTPSPEGMLFIPGPDVTFQGVKLSIPTNLASGVRAQVVPPIEGLGELYPTQAEFTLVDYKTQNNRIEPQILIYPVSKLGETAAGAVQELKQLIAKKPTTLPPNGIPILPTRPAGQLIDVQIQYLTFMGGSGIRVLTQFAQNTWPINNADLVYVFQGVTDDGAYYISAFMPVAAFFLPTRVHDPDTIPPVDGNRYPKFDSANFDAEYRNYHEAVTRKLNTKPANEFAPDLSVLDSLIESLQVELVAAHTESLTAAPTLSMTTTPVFPSSPGQIAFVSNRDGNDEIYMMNNDGSRVRRLTNNPAHDGHPTGSPDGKKIAFVSDRDGNAEIYVMNADGSGVRRLTDNLANDGTPAWSPNGKQIAFISNRDTLLGKFEIYTMNSDGANETRLTNNQTADTCPTWSPDGNQIAFASYEDETANRIAVINRDGSGQRALIDTPGREVCPAWSPDGTRIAFAAASSMDSDIFLVNSDGSNLINLVDDAFSYDNVPGWSPDGQYLVFHSIPGDDIYRIGVDGRGLKNLTNNPGADTSPTWLPGETYLATASQTSESPTDRPTDPCLDSLPTRLRVGLFAYVNPEPPLPNNVRSDAGKSHQVIGDIEAGGAMKILEGPQCVDGWVWWKVRSLDTELQGWTAEGNNKNYWLIPCESRSKCAP